MDKFITRVVTVEALQLTHSNMVESAALCGGEFKLPANAGGAPYISIKTSNGLVVPAIAGMWIVKSPRGWVTMTDKNFRRKYELANDKGERVPPYSTGDVAPPYDR